MKKLLLAGTAIAGVAVLAHPAHADLKLDLEGYFRGYAVYAENKEDVDAAGANKLHKFDFLRDNEVHFTGQTTLDNGLTVGVHNEIKLGSEANSNFGAGGGAGQPNRVNLLQQPGDDPTMVDETYAYFQGDWGRVNLGVEDGAAYLLQVAVPSADSNIDGLRVYIQGFDVATWTGAAAGSSGTNVPLGYDNAPFRQSERLTYLTPKWNGFQAGASYAAKAGMDNPFGGTFGLTVDNKAQFGNEFKDLWEAAARWDGEFQGFGISAGGGYSGATANNTTGAGLGALGSKNFNAWDAGLNFTWQQFSLGGAYVWSDTGVNTSAAQTGGHDDRKWVLGLAWDNGPWHVGGSYLWDRIDAHAYGNPLGIANGQHLKLDRWTGGAGYTYGPGMTFRGSVAALRADSGTTDADHPTQWQVAVGTDINF